MKTLSRLRKRWRLLLPIIGLGSFAAWLVLGLYFLLYSAGSYPKLVDSPVGFYPVPCQNPPVINQSGKALFLGDLHLRASDGPSKFAGLSDFLRREKVTSMIFAGDLFDSPSEAEKLLSTKSDEGKVQAILSILGIETSNVSTYFIRGSPVHDPPNLELTVQTGGLSFVSVGKCARFLIDNVSVTALHGDDAFGGLHGLLFAYLTGRPFLEGWWKERIGLSDSEWVVMAHSHVPGIDEVHRVANTGGWTDLLGFGPPKGKGILIAEGTVRLVTICP